HRQHRQGQGRLLHGEPDRLARLGAQQGADGEGARRAARARSGREGVMATMKATRDAFGEALVKAGEKYPNVVVLDADLAKSTKSEAFAKKFSARFFEMGIAEANMVGTAAGLALAGKVPFCCSFACFVTGRFDTLRISVAYSKANVKVVGS